MKRVRPLTTNLVLLATLLSGCAAQLPTASRTGTASSTATQAAPASASATITVACEGRPDLTPPLFYAGKYFGYETNIPLKNLAEDIYCADRFREQYKNGFVTVFGSSRIAEFADCSKLANATEKANCEATKPANDAVFALVKEFSQKWSEKHGEQYPIMTGAGPGLMLAASIGAMNARDKHKNKNIPSIGYTTYFDKPDRTTQKCKDGSTRPPDRLMCGYPEDAFVPQKLEGGRVRVVHTGGLVFSSIVEREAAMIKHSAAIILAPGGSGSEWEYFQTLEMIKSSQNKAVPVFLLGGDEHWNTFEARVQDMIKRGTVSEGDLKYGKPIKSADELVEMLEAQLIRR